MPRPKTRKPQSMYRQPILSYVEKSRLVTCMYTVNIAVKKGLGLLVFNVTFNNIYAVLCRKPDNPVKPTDLSLMTEKLKVTQFL